MQTHRSIGEERLYLCDEEVALLEEGSHLQFVGLQFSTL